MKVFGGVSRIRPLRFAPWSAWKRIRLGAAIETNDVVRSLH